MRLVLVLLIALLFAAPAEAAPRALATIGEDEGFVLVGDQVVYTQTSGRTIRVQSVPLAGGEAKTIFTHTAPPGRYPYGEQLVAGPGRAAMLVGYRDRRGQFKATQVFAGSPSGGWGAVVPLRAIDLRVQFPNVVQVAGEQIVTYERKGNGLDEYEVALYEPARRVLPFEFGAQFSGDLVVHSERGPLDQALRERVLVTNWRTGAQVSAAEFPDLVGGFQLEADGRLFVTAGKTLYALPPGGAPTPLATGLSAPTVAGERVLYFRKDGVGVFENGSRRRFGVRTERLERFVTDGRNVLWSANGCLLLAPITDPAAAAPGPGPCARSEFAVSPAITGRTARATVRCVAAPARACRGALEVRARGKLIGRAALRLPVGRSATRTIKLRRAGADSVELVVDGYRQPIDLGV